MVVNNLCNMESSLTILLAEILACFVPCTTVFKCSQVHLHREFGRELREPIYGGCVVAGVTLCAMRHDACTQHALHVLHMCVPVLYADGTVSQST
jgi:hypothetical protein